MKSKKSFLDMFARSPIRPLQRHMEKANGCVELLSPFYQAVQTGHWQKARGVYNEINELEHDADDLKRDLRLHLPNNLFLPVSRGDLLCLLANQETLANKAKDIAGIMLGREMRIPSAFEADFEKYLSRSVDASKQAKRAINELDELLESGFRGKEISIVENMIDTLNEIEHETDQMQIELRQALFHIENDVRPMEAMFLYKIIEWVGCLADGAQQAGYQLQLLLAD